MESNLGKLQSLLAAVSAGNRFYAGRIPAGVSSLDEFFERTPFTRKQELVDDQLVNPPFGTNLTYPIERYVRINQTSGTTGKPLYWLDTAESWDAMLDNWERVYRAADVRSGDRIFLAFSFGMFLGFWTAFESAARLGCMRIPGGGMSSVARLRAVINIGATVLCCTPTYALRLAEVATEEGIDLAAGKVRRIMVAGEPGGSLPHVCSRIEKVWPGARVVDHHGMTETGPVSYECPRRAGVLHVMESAFLAEVIDPSTGVAVAVGGRGELVLTTLQRIGSPLLRYRTGDLVELGSDGRCECGSGEMSLVGGILGRTDDMLVVRGVNVYPAAVDEVIRRFADVAEYRVEVDDDRSLAELRVLVEPSPECREVVRLTERVQAELQNVFGLRIVVLSVGCGELPRFEMKARRWVRNAQ
jgi:phenylacetate-CoA ligase